MASENLTKVCGDLIYFLTTVITYQFDNGNSIQSTACGSKESSQTSEDPLHTFSDIKSSAASEINEKSSNIISSGSEAEEINAYQAYIDLI